MIPCCSGALLAATAPYTWLPLAYAPTLTHIACVSSANRKLLARFERGVFTKIAVLICFTHGGGGHPHAGRARGSSHLQPSISKTVPIRSQSKDDQPVFSPQTPLWPLPAGCFLFQNNARLRPNQTNVASARATPRSSPAITSTPGVGSHACDTTQ